MRVLFDTNVVLDAWLDREPHSADASTLIAHVDRGELSGCVSATTVTTLHYLAAKGIGARRARKLLRDLLDMFDVAPVDGDVLGAALDAGLADYEDAVLIGSARAARVTTIVTRDKKGFGHSDLAILSPAELLAVIALG